MKKICPNCKKEFVNYATKVKFCCRQCYYDYRQKNYITEEYRENLSKKLKESMNKKSKEDIVKANEKRKATCLKKYNSEYTIRSNIVQEKIKQTCLEKYGVENPLASEEIRLLKKKKIKDKYGVENISQLESTKNKVQKTCLKKYGVLYACQRREAQEHKTISNINKKFYEFLKQQGLFSEYEYKLKSYSYDLKVDNFLIEINPCYTHDVLKNVWYRKKPLEKNYHLKKTITGLKANFNVIHVWDWDNNEDIIKILKYNTEDIFITNNIKSNTNISKKFLSQIINIDELDMNRKYYLYDLSKPINHCNNYKYIKMIKPKIHEYNVKTKDHKLYSNLNQLIINNDYNIHYLYDCGYMLYRIEE